jgi:hypothetical protein
LPKKKIEKPQREMTHRQLTHWQKEKKTQRFVLIAGIIVLIAIIATIGTGLYMAKYKPLHEVVLTIGDQEYNTDYAINTMSPLIAMYESYGMTVSEEDSSTIANTALQSIERYYFMTEAAGKLTPSVTVSDDEVMKYIEENKLTKDQSRQDAVRSKLVSDKLKNDYFSPQLPATAEHRSIWAMLLESQSQAEEIKARLNSGEKFTDIAAELSLDPTTKEKKGDLGLLPKGLLSSVLTSINSGNVTFLEDKLFDPAIVKNELTIVEDPTLMKNIGYWLIKVTEASEDNTQAHIYAMLLGSRQQAEEIKAKLVAGGEGNDWATLAKYNSQYKDAPLNGGDLNFLAKGTLGDVVDKIVFDENGKVIIAKDTLIGPLADTAQSTDKADWLIQINEIKDQPISDTNRTVLVNKLLNDWFEKYWTDNQDRIVESFNPDQQKYAFNEALKR